MAPRRTYEGGLVQGVAIPNIGFEQYEAQRRASADLNERLQQIKNFALKAGSYEAQLRAADYVAGNAPDLSVYEKSNLEERKKLEEEGYFKGKVTDKTFTLYDKAVREHQINFIKSKFETMAITSFEDIVGAAELGLELDDVIEPDQLMQMLESQINGLSDAIIDMDGAAGLEVRADLAKLGDSYYQSYLDKFIKKQKDIVDAQVVAQTQGTYKAIKRFLSYGNVAPYGVDQNGEMQSIATVNYLLGSYKDSTRAKLIAGGITAPDLEKWETEWDKQVVNQSVAYATSLLKDTTKANDPLALNKIALSASNENFSSNSIAEGIYSQLEKYPEARQKIIDDVRQWATNSINIIEKREAIKVDTQKKNFSKIQAEYRKAIAKRNYETAKDYRDAIILGKDLDGDDIYDPSLPDLSTEIDKIVSGFAEKETSSFFVDQKKIQEFTIRMVQGDLSVAEIENNTAYLGYDKASDLILKVNAREQSAFQQGVAILKNAYNVPDLVVGTTDAKIKFAKEYLDNYNNLLNWFIDNEGTSMATEDKIIQYAQDLINKTPIQDEINNWSDRVAADLQEVMDKQPDEATALLDAAMYIKTLEGYEPKLSFTINIVTNKTIRDQFIRQLNMIAGSRNKPTQELYDWFMLNYPAEAPTK